MNVGLALICPTTVLLLLLLRPVGLPDLWNSTCWFVLYYGFLHWTLLIVPQDSWQRLADVAPDMDAVIRDPRERTRLATFVRRTLRLDVQIAIALISFVSGVVGATAAADAQGVSIAAAVPFELSIGLTMAFGSNVVLWIIGGLVWVHAMSRLESIRFDPIDPTRSPGLARMYHLVTRVQWYATGGLVLALLPHVVLYNDTRDSAFLQTTLFVAGCASVVVVLLVYTLPPWYLHLMRVRDKDALLSELHEQLPCDLPYVSPNELRTAQPKLDLYREIQSRPTGGLDRGVLTSLVAALVTIAAAFLPLLLDGGPTP